MLVAVAGGVRAHMIPCSAACGLDGRRARARLADSGAHAAPTGLPSTHRPLPCSLAPHPLPAVREGLEIVVSVGMAVPNKIVEMQPPPALPR